MSASPGDPQPVFDLIVERARDLCDAHGATVFAMTARWSTYARIDGRSERILSVWRRKRSTCAVSPAATVGLIRAGRSWTGRSSTSDDVERNRIWHGYTDTSAHGRRGGPAAA